MKKLLLTLLLTTSFSSFALDLDFLFGSFCYKSPKVQDRGGVWYLPNQQEPFTGENLCVYKINGQYHSKGNILNGLKDGKWTQWHKNGQKKNEGNFKDGKSVSETKYKYYGNGLIESEGKEGSKDPSIVF